MYYRYGRLVDSPDDLILKGVRLSPGANAGETEDVATVGQNTKPPGRVVSLFLHYRLHADAADLIYTSRDGKRFLHVLLVFGYAFLWKINTASDHSSDG